MGAVDVGVGHDDDAVVAQLGDVEVVGAAARAGGARAADAGAQRRDHREDFVAGEQLLVARLFHVQDLAAQRQDGLELPVAALLGGTAGGVALHQVDLAQRGVLFLAVGQLAGQAHAVEHALAARHFARLAGGFAGTGGFDDLAADDLGVVRALLQVIGQEAADDVFHRRAHFAGHQLVLGLARELGLGHLHAQHAAQAFAHVVAGDFDLRLLGELVFFDVLVDDAGHRGAQAREVGAAVTLRNVVGEAQHLLVVAAVPLHRHFDADVRARDAAVGVGRLFASGIERVRMQDGLALVDELHEAAHAAGAREVVFLAGAFVEQADAHTVVQEAQLAQALAQDFVMEIGVFLEDLGVGQEVHLGAALVGVTDDLHRRDLEAVHGLEQTVLHEAAAELELVDLAFAAHDEAQLHAQRVHAAHAHAVQATRHLVAVLVELAAGMQLGERDFSGRTLGLVLVVHLHAGGNAAAVVGDGNRVVAVDGDDDVVAVAGQRLVDGVVDHFEHQVVQARAVGGIADVHARALAHRLEPFEDRDRAFAVAGVGGRDLDRHRTLDLGRVDRLGVGYFGLVFFGTHSDIPLSLTAFT
ncbi:hypothetical protein QFZ47_002555 [Variovorax paradoxus]|nr:hypothetical protein [Variovorax paradoxus]